MGYNLSGIERDFKSPDLEKNVRKLDRYLIISYCSLAPNAEFFVIYSIYVFK